MGIVGRNGIGKTSFLDLLTGGLEPTNGIIERGESLIIGYYQQKGIDFREDETVLDTVSDTRLLNRFLFPREMLSTRINKLSGGEKRRLYLLSILVQNPNLLILDEPTNDLDIVTLNILEEYLLDFKGTLIIVSHDRHFMDRIADHLLVFMGNGQVKDFVGTFSEYRSFIKDYESAEKAAQRPAEPRQTKPAPAEPAKRKLSWKQQRELEAIEARLPELEQEKKALEAEMSAGTLPYDALQAAAERIKAIMEETSTLETRWLELSEI